MYIQCVYWGVYGSVLVGMLYKYRKSAGLSDVYTYIHVLRNVYYSKAAKNLPSHTVTFLPVQNPVLHILSICVGFQCRIGCV